LIAFPPGERQRVIEMSLLPGSGALKPMQEAQIVQGVQLLDLMLGGHCLVGALLHLSRKHRLPTRPTIALLQDAMPRQAFRLSTSTTVVAAASPSSAP
jgi:hypothetical protein